MATHCPRNREVQKTRVQDKQLDLFPKGIAEMIRKGRRFKLEGNYYEWDEEGLNKYITYLKHRCGAASQDESPAFELDEESDGTRRFLDLLPGLYRGLNSDFPKVFIIDELERSLHTLLARQLISTFMTSGNGQFIFTTHDTNLLDLDLLRADEFWFAEKDAAGGTQLRSLAEYQWEELKIIAEGDQNKIEEAYLSGRFGAVPYSRFFDRQAQ